MPFIVLLAPLFTSHPDGQREKNSITAHFYPSYLSIWEHQAWDSQSRKKNQCQLWRFFISVKKVNLLQTAGISVGVVCLQSVSVQRLEVRTFVTADPDVWKGWLFFLQISGSNGDRFQNLLWSLFFFPVKDSNLCGACIYKRKSGFSIDRADFDLDEENTWGSSRKETIFRLWNVLFFLCLWVDNTHKHLILPSAQNKISEDISLTLHVSKLLIFDWPEENGSEYYDQC